VKWDRRGSAWVVEESESMEQRNVKKAKGE